MSAHVFTAGTPAERRAWVAEVARGMREEAAVKYQIAAALERGARALETCDAEAGEIPVDALGLACFEFIKYGKIARILGLPKEGSALRAELLRLGARTA